MRTPRICWPSLTCSVCLLAALQSNALPAQEWDPKGVECEGDVPGEPADWQAMGTAAPIDVNCFRVPVGPPGEEGWLEHTIAGEVAGGAYEIRYWAHDLELDLPDEFRLLQLCGEGVCPADGRPLTIRLRRNVENTAHQVTIDWQSDDDAGQETPNLDLPDPFRLRVVWHRSTLSPDIGPRRNGYLKVWLKDIFIFEKDGLLLFDTWPELVQTGACGDVDANTVGDLYLEIVETAVLY